MTSFWAPETTTHLHKGCGGPVAFWRKGNTLYTGCRKCGAIHEENPRHEVIEVEIPPNAEAPDDPFGARHE